MILRTPEERFENLPDYPFAPNYTNFGEARIHFVDEGNKNSDETVLMLHGEPSWSFLYRKMIPIVAAANTRVIAPDLIGFGKSDKFAEAEKYTYAMHVESITALIENLDLKNITLVCQDWGGLIGLRIAAENSREIFAHRRGKHFSADGRRRFSGGFQNLARNVAGIAVFSRRKNCQNGLQNKTFQEKS